MSSQKFQNFSDTSWQHSGKWYNKLVREKGHYYHQHVIFPNVSKLLHFSKDSAVLDIGCGQGIFARQLPKDIPYTGIDLAKSLISLAKQYDKNPLHEYVVANATEQLLIKKNDYSHAVAILSLQNMERQEDAIFQVSKHLKKDGIFAIVLNHPCFRIPRQSGWGISENKQQYRYVNRYQTPLRIPIATHPGEKQSSLTWSFHYPLSSYFHFLQTAGFVIEQLEEWASDKESIGKASKMENRARLEIPLFLCLIARKI